ncbi:MAG: ester cyclase, partial [Actinobacteria bacterium]|nr:ester cyclase [Actinomycetota bacterium]
GLGGEPIRGAVGFAVVVAAARDGHQSLTVTIEDLITYHDRAAARLRWLGVRTSGEPVERETLEIVRIEDGRAIEHWGGRS